ncbi:MAG: hypothetical protein AB1635_07215 [Acidobacteriota bacterium]
MATPHPPITGHPRATGHTRALSTTLGVVAAGAVSGALVAATALWLLLTDPAVAAEVSEEGSLVPVFEEVVALLGRAVVEVLRYL